MVCPEHERICGCPLLPNVGTVGGIANDFDYGAVAGLPMAM